MQNISHNESYRICDSPVWDNDLFWWTSTPRLTLCFRQTILTTIAPIVLLLLTPFDFRYFLGRVDLQSSPWRWRNVSSAILNMALIGISFAHLIRSVWKDVYYWSSVFEPSVDFVGLSVAYFLQIIYRRNGRRISIALQIFWLITTIVSIIRLYLEHNYRSKSTVSPHVPYLIIYCVYISISFVLFVLSFICDKSSDRMRLYNTRRGDKHKHFCPLENDSAFSRLTIFWVFRFLRKGFRNKIEFKDFNKICHSIKAKYLSQLFLKYDYKYNTKAFDSLSRTYRKNKRLVPVLCDLCSKFILFCCFLTLIYIPALYIQPYLLNKILLFITEPNALEWHGIVFAIAFSLSGLVSTLSSQHISALMEMNAIKCKSALISAVYRKMFRLSPTSRRQYTSGQILNLMSVDSNEIFNFVRIAMNLIIVPINCSIGLYILWQFLGIASLGLAAVMLIIIPFNVLIGRKLDKMQKNKMYFTDKRMSKISEILNCIKVIKLNAWELPFIEKVTQSRDEELRGQRRMAVIYAFIVLIWKMTPVLSASACFLIYAVTEYSKFNAKTVFVSLSILNILRPQMQVIPSVFTNFIRAIVSLKRLSVFLSAEELDDHSIVKIKRDNTYSVSIEKATLSYSLDKSPVFNNLTIDIRKGSLIAVVGEVGAGKSTLLSAIIGDLYKTTGHIKVNGSVAYVPQTAWIRNTSLKKNIIFTADEDENRYQEVIAACALLPDLSALPFGDQTEIGEKGINLSGGQKQRVSLARAVFQNCDIYLLDDPLSAVDSHVAQHLFREVIGSKGLLRYKTRILCSHNLSFLRNCDQIYVLCGGEMVGFGSYDELSALGLLAQINTIDQPLDDKALPQIDSQFDLNNSHKVSKTSNNTNISETESRVESTGDEINTLSVETLEPSEPTNLTEEEQMQTGSVLWKDYGRYITNVGIVLFITIVLFRFGSNGSEIGLNYWLSLWSNRNNSDSDSSDRNYRFLIYGSILVSEGVFILLGNIVLFVATIKASKRLHSKALYGVMRSSLLFFDRTPIGRILNRFSLDISTVDESIPDIIISLLDVLTFFVILWAFVFYRFMYLSLQLLAIIVLFYLIYKFYLRTCRQMRRLESVSNSPIQSHFCESIDGTSSIRAYNVLAHFVADSNKKIDLSLNCYYHRISLNIWLRIWCQTIGIGISLIISIYIVCNRNDITVGLAGLVLIYCVESVDSIAYTIRLMAALETQMISFERVREFCDLSPEKDWNSSVNYKPSKNWPKNGSIEYQNYFTSYRTGLKPVLKNINFAIKSGEKVGIVGRTGAGKSSLTLSLFRILEPISGRILIDGLDISRIGLHDLRSRLTIIPQDPLLFADTLRVNMDPLALFDDNQLWNALNDSNLKEFVESLPEKLDFKVTENGDNLSAGQKQLICLSRALLRKTKILVMDEAMSCCDVETDRIIQRTIREKFKDCTVLTIAHRMDTIIDSDTILVFDFGSLVENDSPNNLLSNKESIFYSLAKEAKIV